MNDGNPLFLPHRGNLRIKWNNAGSAFLLVPGVLRALMKFWSLFIASSLLFVFSYISVSITFPRWIIIQKSDPTIKAVFKEALRLPSTGFHRQQLPSLFLNHLVVAIGNSMKRGFMEASFLLGEFPAFLSSHKWENVDGTLRARRDFSCYSFLLFQCLAMVPYLSSKDKKSSKPYFCHESKVGSDNFSLPVEAVSIVSTEMHLHVSI